MRKLSTGADSTLGNYKRLAIMAFGQGSTLRTDMATKTKKAAKPEAASAPAAASAVAGGTHAA